MVRKIIKWSAAIMLVGLIVPQAVEAASAAFTSSSAATPAVKGTNSAAGGKGVEGYASAASGTSYAVFGTSKSPNGVGVFGRNLATSGYAWGLKGQSSSSTGRGLEGYASASSADTHWGVIGTAKGTGGVGVGGIGISGGLGLLGEGAMGVLGASESSDPAIVGVNVTQSTPAGAYGVVSANDLGVSGHVNGAFGNVIGSCAIAASAADSTNCTFAEPFTSTGSPMVFLTAISDPGGYLYVSGFSGSSGNWTGFTVTRVGTLTNPVSINWFAVGRDPILDPASAQRQAWSRMARNG